MSFHPGGDSAPLSGPALVFGLVVTGLILFVFVFGVLLDWL